MFNDIDKVYFGKRIVKDVSEKDEKDLVTVTFADDQKPESEKMHISEWESGKSDKAITKPDEVQEWFVKRTSFLRQDAVNQMIRFNPRFADLKRITTWIQEGITRSYLTVVSAVFGVKNFDTDATVDMVLNKLEEDGQDFSSEWTEIEKIVFSYIRERGVTVHDIVSESFFGGMQQKLGNLINQGVAVALGGEDESRRCNVFDDLIKKYAKDRSTEGLEGVGTSNQDAAVVADEGKNEASVESKDDKNVEEGAA